MSGHALPRLPDLAAGIAWLLGGTEGRQPEPAWQDDLVELLVRRRLAPEVAASPRLADAGLHAASRRRLAIERERTRAAAEARAPAIRAAGEALSRAGVPAVLLKGLAVIEITHGDASRRPMADADLLVGPEDRGPAREALLGAGFSATGSDTPLHDVLVHRGALCPAAPHGVAVEVHVDLFPPPHPFGVDVAGIVGAAGPSATWPGLLVPDAAHALVALAFQLVLHESDGVKSWLALRDLALLSARPVPRDGQELADACADVARSWGVGPLVAEACGRAAAWAGGDPALAAVRAAFDRAPGRRALALRLALSELDATVAEAGEAPPRALSRRLAAALWHDSVTTSTRQLVAGLVGGGGRRSLSRSLRVLARHADAALRSARAP